VSKRARAAALAHLSARLYALHGKALKHT
jgi:hypothetical protein